MLSKHKDMRGGTLLAMEFADLSFVPQRVFCVVDAPAGAIRGGHAHKECLQLLVCLRGQIRVSFDGQQNDILLAVGDSYLIQKGVWAEQEYLTGDDVLMVLCSLPYDANDYIKERPSSHQ